MTNNSIPERFFQRVAARWTDVMRKGDPYDSAFKKQPGMVTYNSATIRKMTNQVLNNSAFIAKLEQFRPGDAVALQRRASKLLSFADKIDRDYAGSIAYR